PIPMPATTSASRMLTTAMIPRKTFVVPRFPSIGPSEGARLMGRRIVGPPRGGFSHRFSEELPSLAGNAGGPIQRAPEMVELARKLFNSRLELATQCSAAVREEQVTGNPSDDGSDGRCCNGPCLVSHCASSHTQPIKLLQV